MSHSFSTKEVLHTGWRAFCAHPWRLIWYTAFVLGLCAFFNQVQLIAAHKFSLPLQLVVVVLSFFAQLVLGMGLTHVAVRAARGRNYGINDLFRPGEAFVSFIVASLFFAVVLLAGSWLAAFVVSYGNWPDPMWQTVIVLFFSIVWYFIFGLRYIFYSYAIVDKHLGARAGLRQSARITKGQRGALMRLMLVIVLLNMLGAFFFFFGLLITIPVTFLALATAYLRLLERRQSAEILAKIDPAPQA